MLEFKWFFFSNLACHMVPTASRVMGALVTLLSFTSGCVSDGVTAPLKPNSALTQQPDFQLGYKALETLQSLDINEVQVFETPSIGLARIETGYYIVRLEDGMPIPESGIYLGLTPDESAAQLVAAQQQYENQQASSQEALANTLAIATDGYSRGLNGTSSGHEEAQSENVPQPPIEHEPITTIGSRLVAAPPPADGENAVLPRAPRYTSSEVHSVIELLSRGAFIVLDDSTVWKIDMLDRFNTGLWLPLTEVTVKETEYKGYIFHELVNLEDPDSVSATFIGSVALSTNISGEFKGWEGDTVFNLLNGQVVKQIDYKIHYYYAYMPKVLFVNIGVPGLHEMIVDGVQETVGVYVVR